MLRCVKNQQNTGLLLKLSILLYFISRTNSCCECEQAPEQPVLSSAWCHQKQADFCSQGLSALLLQMVSVKHKEHECFFVLMNKLKKLQVKTHTSLHPAFGYNWRAHSVWKHCSPRWKEQFKWALSSIGLHWLFCNLENFRAPYGYKERLLPSSRQRVYLNAQLDFCPWLPFRYSPKVS